MATRSALVQNWGKGICRYLMAEKSIPLATRKGRPHLRAVSSPRVMTFAIRPRKSADLKKIVALDEELAMELYAGGCRIVRYFGEVLIEIPLPQQLWSTVSVDQLSRKGGMWMSLGLTTRMTPVNIKLSDGTSLAPILVAGRVGAGKTEMLKLMLWQLAEQNPYSDNKSDVKFVIYDPKGKFLPVARLPHLAMPLLRTQADAAKAIGWLLFQMNSRMEKSQLVTNNGGSVTFPKLIFFVDELINLMNDTDIENGIGRLASLGREMGIYTVLATQRPDRKYMDKLAAANIGLRLVGQTTDKVEANLASKVEQSGAHLLSGKGDMLVIVDERVHRMQAGYVPQNLFDNLPKMDDVPMPIDGGNAYNLRALLGDVSTTAQSIYDAPYSPREIATALTGLGIIRLKQRLGMGQPRATRLRQEWGDTIMEELSQLGYEIVRKEGE